MPGIVGTLGYLPFCGGLGSAFTFEEITKNRRNVFVKHRIINGNDLLEDCGVEPIELDIRMKFVTGYTLDASLSLVALEALMDAKIPVPILVGGVPLGRQILTLFVVESISSKMSKWQGSTLIELECTVKVIEHGNPLGLSGPLGALAQAGLSVVGNLV